MEQTEPRTPLGDATDTRPLRRVLITAALIIVGILLVAVAIYAGAFMILAPMMQ
jgi:hypothetical protein